MDPALPSESASNRQAIMFVAGFAVILLFAGAFAYYFLFLSPYSSPQNRLASSGNSQVSPTVAPTPTPTINPFVVIKQAYANPFSEETQYKNPFDDKKNPFDDLQ